MCTQNPTSCPVAAELGPGCACRGKREGEDWRWRERGQPWRLGSLLSHRRVMKGLGDRHQDIPAHSFHPHPPLGTGKGGTRPQLFCHRRKTAAQGNGFFLSTLRMNVWPDIPARAHTKLQEELGPVDSLAAQALHGCDPTHSPSKCRRQRASPYPWVYLSMQYPPQSVCFTPLYHHTI